MDSILEYVKKQKGKLVGYFPVSFPVYVVHVEYDSMDTDPFFPIYKAILRYTKADPKHENLSYFANIIGFERSLLTSCIRYLKEEGMLRWQQESLVVTSDAEKKYLTVNSRPTVRVTGSFIVDGKDLTLLPKIVYTSKRNLMRFDGNVSPHLPVDISIKTAYSDKLLHDLERGPVKDLLHLESSGTNFEIVGFDKKFLKGAVAVFYYDADSNLNKIIMYGGTPVNCTALESPVDYSIIMKNDDNQWSFRGNIGYNVGITQDICKLALVAPNEGICYIVQQRYKLPTNYVIKIKFEDKTLLPIVVIDEALLLESKIPEIVINDANSNFIDFPVIQHGMIRIAIVHSIQRYIDFVSDITEWDIAGKKEGIAFKSMIEKKYPDWRKLLVMFKKLDILESIDRDCFILSRKEN